MYVLQPHFKPEYIYAYQNKGLFHKSNFVIVQLMLAFCVPCQMPAMLQLTFPNKRSVNFQLNFLTLSISH